MAQVKIDKKLGIPYAYRWKLSNAEVEDLLEGAGVVVLLTPLVATGVGAPLAGLLAAGIKLQSIFIKRENRKGGNKGVVLKYNIIATALMVEPLSKW